MNGTNITLAQLHVLQAVVDHGSFTAAARALSMSQGAVSHSIAGLESELGTVLLERNRNGVVCTEIGTRVLQLAREILAGTERIRQEVAASQGLERGTVRVGSFPSITTRFMPGLLRHFGQRFPGIDIVLFEGSDDEVRSWIADRTVDAGVVTLPCAAYELHPIATDTFVAVVPATHELAQHASLQVEQLAQPRFIMSTSGCESLIFALFHAHGCRPQIGYEVRDVSTIFAMVRAGLGVSVVPSLTLPDTLDGICTVTIEPQTERKLALAIPAPASTAPAVAAFVREAHAWGIAHGFLPPE